jgi:hypothetical protein
MLLQQVVVEKFENLKNILGERQLRLWAASEALSIGYGGISIVNRATRLSRQTIQTGIKELQQGIDINDSEYMRRKGGGRKTVEEIYPDLLNCLRKLIEDYTRGNPTQPLLWTSKSTAHLAEELAREGYIISDRTVARLLHSLHYSLQSNLKSLEGKRSEERNSQFEYINKQVCIFQAASQPVISVDTKKKELIGEFKNAGQEWRPQKMPREVKVHDFGKEKAIPYGIYDVTWNMGWVNVGLDHDTAEFAVESIRKWWHKMGKEIYKDATSLLITADSGGSNSRRCRLWKLGLQKLADETGLQITVCHLPPGTSKWNKIEHRLFCHITKNWQASPLISYEVIVNLIAHTRTKTGLRVFSELDRGMYPTGKKVPNVDMDAMLIVHHEVNEKWNYTINSRAEFCQGSCSS